MNSIVEERAGSSDFSSRPDLDGAHFNPLYQEERRVRIPDFLEPLTALRLHEHLARDIEWKTFLVANGLQFAVSPTAHAAATTDIEQGVLHRAHQGARTGFACLYDANRLFDEDLPQPSVIDFAPDTERLATLGRYVNSAAFLDLARAVTGVAELSRAAVQAVRYRIDHFSTFRKAPVPTERWGTARVGFLLNLSPEWKPEWGGCLHFRSNYGDTAEAFIPSFNVLDLFSLSRGCWTSPVAAFADHPRLAIAGRLYTN